MTLEEKLSEIYKDAERGAYSGEYITTIIQALRKAIEQRDFYINYINVHGCRKTLLIPYLENRDKELLEILEGK